MPCGYCTLRAAEGAPSRTLPAHAGRMFRTRTARVSPDRRGLRYNCAGNAIRTVVPRTGLANTLAVPPRNEARSLRPRMP